MASIYDVDSVLEDSRPVIRFRGRDYEVRDLTVKETIANIRNAKKQEEKINNKIKEKIRKEVVEEGFEENEVQAEVNRRMLESTWEDHFEEYLTLAVDTLKKSLKDFDVDDITVREYKALRAALENVQQQTYSIEANQKKVR